MSGAECSQCLTIPSERENICCKEIKKNIAWHRHFDGEIPTHACTTDLLYTSVIAPVVCCSTNARVYASTLSVVLPRRHDIRAHQLISINRTKKDAFLK